MTGGKPLAGPRITVDRQKMAALVLVRGVYNSISPADILGNMVDPLSPAFLMFRSRVRPIQSIRKDPE